MFGLGTGEIFVILFIVLLLFGAKKLPELAKGLGKGVKEFKKASDDLKDEVNKSIDSEK
jgi:sec-independent protein translocase protein TatA